VYKLHTKIENRLPYLKAAVLQMLKYEEKIIKFTVNTGPVMFSGEIYYTDPLIQLTKYLVKHRFSLHNYCATNAVAVMFSRNIPMAEKRIVCFQSKICSFFISNNYYIYLKGYFEIFVFNDF